MGSTATELHAAVAANDVGLVERVLLAGHDIDLRDASGQSALHYAAKFGAVECLRALIDHGASVDLRDDSRQTPLYLATAAEHNAPEMIMVLRGAGADPFATSAGGGAPFDLAKLWDDEIADCYSDISAKLRGESYVPEVPNAVCFATRALVDSIRRVGLMDRDDHGTWFFAAGTETQNELDDPRSSAIYSLQTIASMDPSIVNYLESDPGTSLARQPSGDFAPN